ncbi:MAG: AAA family ATPase [Candidatus Eremiobacteraeota bacterium]|nr:AAA family ATPase [Candidatus Eremiobacteraeota bacterium]
MLQIKFLGHPRFFVDGTPYKFTAPPKTLPLLGYLLLNANASLRRDALAYTLWPDDTEEAARTDLRRHLNYLKSGLPVAPEDRPWFLADGESVQWNPDSDCSFDVAEFERLSSAVNERAAAAELYGGDLLENLYDEWLFAPRERLRSLYLDILNGLLLASRSRRDFAQAITYAQRILIADPWREDTLRELLTVRYEAGDRAGALREFSEFQRRLSNEISVEPMPETLSLRNLILRNDALPSIQLSEAATPQGSETAQISMFPFVGREAELEHLTALWNRAARGRGGLVLIGGEAGIGKSRLVSEFALRAGAQGGRVLVGTTLSPESFPYEPIVQSLRSASPGLSSLDIDAVWLNVISKILPEAHQEQSDSSSPPRLDSQRERIRLFEAMLVCFGALAKSRPVCLILEDLHWASAATTAALDFLARRAESRRILIVGTYREEEAAVGDSLREMRRNLRRENLASHVDLAGLPEASVIGLLDSIPQLAERGGQIAKDAVAESRGNPLFLTEIIRELVETGAPGLQAQGVPRGLSGTIAARIARLSEDAQFLCQIASVVGTVFDIDIVREVIGWPEREVLDALEELLRRQVVHEAGKRNAFDYAFSHHLVQRTVYGGVDAAGRVRWHRRAAHALEQIHKSRLEEIAGVIARHFDGAGEPESAAAYYLQAARRALSLYANAEAFTLASRALELTRENRKRMDLYALCETIQGRQGNRAEQAVALEEMERLADAADVEGSCEALYRRIIFHRALGERKLEVTYIERLASRAELVPGAFWRARAAHALAIYQTSVGKFSEASLSTRLALGEYAECGDAGGEAECLCAFAYLNVYQSKSQESEAAFERARAAAESSGNQALLARTYLSASAAANIVLDYALCKQLAEKGLEIYCAIGDREGEADCLTRLGVVAGREFDISAARESFAKAHDVYVAIGKKQGLGAVALNAGLMEFAVGYLDRARTACKSAEGIFSELGDTRGIAVASINLAMLHYHQGDYGVAKMLALRGLELARELGSEPLQAAALSNLGAIERELGNPQTSREHLTASIELRNRSGSTADAALDLAELILTEIRLNNKDDALRLADEVMARDPADYSMTWAPQTVPLAAAAAYQSLRKRKRAHEAMELASHLFRERLAKLPDQETRATYESIPFNQRLLATTLL